MVCRVISQFVVVPGDDFFQVCGVTIFGFERDGVVAEREDAALDQGIDVFIEEFLRSLREVMTTDPILSAFEHIREGDGNRCSFGKFFALLFRAIQGDICLENGDCRDGFFQWIKR